MVVHVEPKIKVAILGQYGVGKTALVNRIRTGHFEPRVEATVGCVFADVDIGGYKLEFWDTAGQERYRAVVSQYYRNAKIIILVFDVNNLTTLEELYHYIFILKSQRTYHPDAKFMVVGNKTDLPHEDTATITKKFQQHPVMRTAGFGNHEPYYVSVKEGENIDIILSDMLIYAKAFTAEEDAEKDEVLKIEVVAEEEVKTGCAC